MELVMFTVYLIMYSTPKQEFSVEIMHRLSLFHIHSGNRKIVNSLGIQSYSIGSSRPLSIGLKRTPSDPNVNAHFLGLPFSV